MFTVVQHVFYIFLVQIHCAYDIRVLSRIRNLGGKPSLIELKIAKILLPFDTHLHFENLKLVYVKI